MDKNLASPKNYEWEWDRSAYPYYLYLFAYQWKLNKWCPSVYSQLTYEKGKTVCYLEKKSLKRAARYILAKVQKDGKFLEDWKEFIFKTGVDLQVFCGKVEKLNLKKLSNEEISKLISEAVFAYGEHTSGVGIIRDTNRILQENFIRIFKSEEIVAMLFSTNKKSFFLTEHEDLLKIAEMSENKNRQDALKAHTQKYFYMTFNYYGANILTQSHFAKKLAETLKAKEKSIDLRNNLRKEKKEKDALLRKLKPSAKIKRLIDFASTCTYFKDFIRGNLNRLHYVDYLLFKEIARRTKKEWEEIALLSFEEIQSLLLMGKKFGKRDSVFIYSDKKGMYLVSGMEAKNKIKTINKNFAVVGQAEIKGTPAFSGKVTGRAFIIDNPKKADGKNGFVMISSMTTPDLMQAMKKSLAIVTDEGGLTCHAAIVSRELKKPCIVGSKIATKVLHDGDLVEVNANKGLVKILKRA